MMGERFCCALVRPPGDAYAGCLRPGKVSINTSRARLQHQSYLSALRKAGVQVREITPLDLPDACFIEDTAVALGEQIVLTRPGALTRRQEIVTVVDFFEDEGRPVTWLNAGTLDGGDVLRVGGFVLIGRSERTDDAGAQALAELVRAANMTPFEVPVTDRVHLKTSCSTLDAVTLIATSKTELPELPAVRVLRVPEGEELAANCVAFDRSVIMPKGHTKTESILVEHGFTPVPLDLSEFEKGGGGATCLSVRY